MKHQSDYYQSRKSVPWTDEKTMTPSQKFIARHYKERYMQRHPKLDSTGEVELINSYIPVQCPYCKGVSFVKAGHTRIGVQRYACRSKCGKTFLPTTGTIFDEHKISLSEWIEYCLNIFRNVSVSADPWNNKNAISTSKYWLEKIFLLLQGYQDDIVLSGKVFLDETYYSVMMHDRVKNADGTNPKGLSRNKICIGVATDKQNTLIIAEGFGKPSQKMSYDTFASHIAAGSILVHDKEKTHRKLVQELSLTSEEYLARDLRKMEDLDNPLDPVNHIHYLVKRFLYEHSGFAREEIQGYLDLYAFVLNPPVNKLEKVDRLFNLAFQNPKLLRYRDRYRENRGFTE